MTAAQAIEAALSAHGVTDSAKQAELLGIHVNHWRGRYLPGRMRPNVAKLRGWLEKLHAAGMPVRLELSADGWTWL